MRVSMAEQDRTGASVFRAALCVCCALLVLLTAVSAGAESTLTWAERMELAREKYNRKTVHVYVQGQGSAWKGKINACYNREKGTKFINIRIRESLQITDEAEMEAVLEVVAQHKYYSVEEYGTISFMKAQWIAHNIAYNMANGSEQQQAMVAMIVGESLRNIISSAKVLDLTPLGNMTEEQRTMYEVVEYLCCHSED